VDATYIGRVHRYESHFDIQSNTICRKRRNRPVCSAIPARAMVPGVMQRGSQVGGVILELREQETEVPRDHWLRGGEPQPDVRAALGDAKPLPHNAYKVTLVANAAARAIVLAGEIA
jgi:hypothetical protein